MNKQLEELKNEVYSIGGYKGKLIGETFERIFKKEDIDFCVKTITKHREDVIRNARFLFKNSKGLVDSSFLFNVINHDKDKLSDIEMTNNYVWVFLFKKIKDIDYDCCNYKKVLYATLLHILTQKHHPEYWAELKKEDSVRIDIKNRDALQKCVDASLMPNNYLCEMVCDWKAVADTHGTTIQSLFDKCLNKRWRFTKEQVDVIQKAIEVFE